MADDKPTRPPLGEPPISILALSDVHLQMLRALQSAVRIVDAWDDLTIVGGLGRFFGGEARRVGDVDVLIAKPLCKQYWRFLEVLSYHGIISLFDVIDRPDYSWRCCHPQIAHARALTTDCAASLSGLTHAKLDICFAADDLAEIPHADKWVRKADIEDLKKKDAQARAAWIAQEHQAFKADRKGEETTLANLRIHPDLKLRYAW